MNKLIKSKPNKSRSVLAAIGVVMKNWHYALLACLVAGALFLLAVWLPNFSFIKSVITAKNFGAAEKISSLFNSLQAFQTNFRPVGQIMLVMVAWLFGLNVSLLSFYLKHRMKLQKEAGISAGGILAGLLGIGCASCGSFILASLFGAGASVAFLRFLPLGGQEFSIIGVAILGWSIFSTAKKIQAPMVC